MDITKENKANSKKYSSKCKTKLGLLPPSMSVLILLLLLYGKV